MTDDERALLRLEALLTLRIKDVATNANDDVAAWRERMRTLIAEGHTAAALLAALQRGETALSDDEAALLAILLDDQWAYFEGFAQAAQTGALSPNAIIARAILYADAIRATYFRIRWGEWDLPWRPGDGQSACRVRCKCWAWVTDNGDGTGIYHWQLAAIEAERHCADCKGREGDHVVYRRPIIERIEETRYVG